jgi:hypothetical protein
MNNQTKIWLVILLLMGSCHKEETPISPIVSGKNLLFISNEGAFGYSNASLSVYYPEEDKVVNNAFEQVNGRGIGDVLQSVFQAGDQLFLLVNASSKIEIISANTLEELGAIDPISLPRYMCSNSQFGYVTSWGNGGQVIEFNLNTFEITRQFPAGNGPEKILWHDYKLFVCNGGGFTNDSTVSIIDLNTRTEITKLVVGDNPMDIMQTEDQKIWVLCKGRILYDDAWQIIGHSNSKLVKINPSSLQIEKSIPLFTQSHPAHLAYDSIHQRLFIGGGFGFSGVFTFDLQTEILNQNAFVNDDFYGIGVDKNGNLIGLKAPNFTTAGSMLIYNELGVLQKQHSLGIGPNGIY